MYNIIGSGIAGLACSYVLSNFDVKNEIFESGDQKIANQYGIQLSPNASNVLQKMGILKKLESHIKIINNIEIYSIEKLKKLTTLPVNKFINKNNLTNYYTASRDILHKELLSNVIASKTKINYDSKIKKVEDLGDKIQIIKENKTISSSKKLIIANGNSSSPIFDRISCSPIANDFMTYRSAVKVHELPIKISADTIYLFLGKGIHVVIYPYFEDLINIVMITKNNKDAVIQKNKQNIDKSVYSFLSAQDWHSWSLYDSKITLNLDTSRPIFAIGDAAHSIKPHLAQGASMALEDAFTLGKSIGEKNTVESVHYAMNMRKKRIDRVIRNSSLNRQIFHAPPIISVFRDFFLEKTNGLGQLDNLKWLYDYKV